MGYWGTGLYQNDTSDDVKTTIEKELRDGRNIEEITEDLIRDFDGVEDDLMERCAFWFAMADTQWKWGRLLPWVEERAMQLLEEGGDIKAWEEVGLVEATLRSRVLLKLKATLEREQPPAKKPIKRRSYKCPWKIGDIYVLQFKGGLAKEKGFYGKYILMQKIDDCIWYPEHIIPIVYIKLTKSDALLGSFEEYDALPYMRTDKWEYEERFLPYSGINFEEDIAMKSKINYEQEEEGWLSMYRISLAFEKKNQVPADLIYFGNFKEAKKPPKEYIPWTHIHVPSICHRYMSEEVIEEKIIDRCERYAIKS